MWVGHRVGQEFSEEVVVDLDEKEILNSARTSKGVLDCLISLMCCS